MATTRADSGNPDIASEEAVRDALRKFHQPDLLALSPLARGRARQERAEHVRALLRAAVECSFGPAPREQELRRTVEAAYLEQGRSHDEVARELGLSPSAYFTRLRRAVDRIMPHALAQAARG